MGEWLERGGQSRSGSGIWRRRPWPWTNRCRKDTPGWPGPTSGAGSLTTRLPKAGEPSRIDPNYADGYLLLSHILIYAGEAEEGVEIAIEGMPLDPDSMYHTLMHLADGQSLVGTQRKGDRKLQEIGRAQIDLLPGYVWLASTYGNLGRQVEAEAAAAAGIAAQPRLLDLGLWREGALSG